MSVAINTKPKFSLYIISFLEIRALLSATSAVITYIFFAFKLLYLRCKE